MNTMISIRMDKDIKEKAECVLDDLGLNLSSAINIFLRQVIREERIPFELRIDVPNKETKKAISEGERLLKKKSTKKYASVDELRKDLNI